MSIRIRDVDIEIECDGCEATFLRKKSEVNRNQKLGRKNYCSRTCQGKANIVNIPEDARGNLVNLRRGSSQDEFSPFRSHLSRLRGRGHEVTITLEDLKAQWDLQRGRCAFTGLPMEIDPTSKQGGKKHPWRASLDRIDSNKGYIPGNIQWICLMANLAKNEWSGDYLVVFANAVERHAPIRAVRGY